MPDSSGIRAGKAFVELSANNSQLKQSLKDSEKDFQHLNDATKNVGGSFFDKLTKNVRAIRLENRQSGQSALYTVLKGGSEGISNTLADALGAGVATIGINFFAGAIKSAAEEASKLRAELAAGDASAGDIVERMMGAIPIFGEVWKAGRAVHNFLTGDEDAIEAMNRDAKLTADLFDAQRAAAERVRKVLLDQQLATERIRANTAAVGKDPFTSERIGINAVAGERGMTLQQRQDEAAKQITDANAKRIADLAALAESKRTQANSFTPAVKYDSEGIAVSEDVGDVNRKAALEKDAIDAVTQLNDARLDVDKKARAAREAVAAEDIASRENDAARLNDVTRRELEQYTQTLIAGWNEASDANNHARAVDLQRQGKAGEAERVLIENDSAKKIAMIIREADAQAKAIGATDPNDIRRAGIYGIAAARIAGVKNEAGAATANSHLADTGKVGSDAHELAQLRIEAMTDAFQREKALVNERYDYELKVAADSGQSLVAIRERKAQEISNLEQRHAKQTADAVADINFDIAAQQIHNTKRGIDERLAMIELERQKALKREQDPSTSTGVGADRINALYDAQKVGAMQNVPMPTFGTFNPAAAAAAGAIGGGQLIGSPTDDAANKKTAQNTGEIKGLMGTLIKAVGDVEGAIKSIVGMTFQ